MASLYVGGYGFVVEVAMPTAKNKGYGDYLAKVVGQDTTFTVKETEDGWAWADVMREGVGGVAKGGGYVSALEKIAEYLAAEASKEFVVVVKIRSKGKTQREIFKFVEDAITTQSERADERDWGIDNIHLSTPDGGHAVLL